VAGQPPSGLAGPGRRSRLEGQEKYPAGPNYPAEHLFTANTYML